jgi:hypothetical protein
LPDSPKTIIKDKHSIIPKCQFINTMRAATQTITTLMQNGKTIEITRFYVVISDIKKVKIMASAEPFMVESSSPFSLSIYAQYSSAFYQMFFTVSGEFFLWKET